VNAPPGGQGGYPGGPWRSQPSITTRRGGPFGQKKGGAGCVVVAVGVFAIICVTAGVIAVVFLLKGRRAELDDAPDAASHVVTTTRPQPPNVPTATARPVTPRPPVKRN
jgi:hypothetical protein